MGASDYATLHIAFSEAAAGSIQKALERVGRRERVIGLPDDLSFGPINPPHTDLRRAWARSVLHLDYDLYDWPAGSAEVFWADATGTNVIPVAWACMTNAAERAGFLEFVGRMVGRSFDVVDATCIETASRQETDGIVRPWALGVMSPKQIVARSLHERAAAFPEAQAEIARAVWHDLRAENAPFRVIRNGILVSAPLTYFDAARR